MSDRRVAAIAVGHDSVVVTLVSGLEEEPLFTDPVELKLEALTPEEVASAVSRIVADSETSVALSIPVSLQGYEDAIRNVLGDQYVGTMQARRLIWYVTDHSSSCHTHYANGFPVDEPVDVLFLALNPGHACARVSCVEKWDDGRIGYNCRPHEGTTFLETPLEDPSTQDLIEKLVSPRIDKIPDLTQLHGIYVFRSEGPCSALFSSLQSKFPDTPIKWVSLCDISHGTAVGAIQRHLGVPMPLVCAFVTLGVPIKIALAGGRLVPAISQNRNVPFKQPVVLTISRDDQTTVTVQFVYGVKPLGTVLVEGLASGKSKGEARIQVCVEVDDDGETAVCVEELGSISGVKTKVQLGNIFDAITMKEIEAYREEHYCYDESVNLHFQKLEAYIAEHYSCDEFGELHYRRSEGEECVLGDLPA